MKRLVCLLAIGALCAIGIGCGAPPAQDAEPEIGNVELVERFHRTRPNTVIVAAAEGDFDGDGTRDLGVVYRDERDRFRTVVLLDRASGPQFTNAHKAPVERQVLEVKDIDGKLPYELVVRGRKGPNIGYAIYRVEDGELVDVFGSNMADCCGN